MLPARHQPRRSLLPSALMSASLDPSQLPPPDLQSQADVERLAQVLKHRLSSLTSSIEGYTDLLTDTLGSPDQRDLAFRIFEGVRGIDQVVADLDIAAACPAPVRRATTPDALSERMIAGLTPQANRLVVDIEAPGTFLADEDLLLRALLSVVRNALEACSDTVLVHVHPGTDAGTLCFDVWNAGALSGPPEPLFQPFFTTKARHLGLGLPYARRIAQAHGGTLETHATDVNQGTCFRLSIPMP